MESFSTTNILALVGGGPTPNWTPDKLIIWDDYQGHQVDTIKFKSPINAVKICRNGNVGRIIIAADGFIHYYNISDLTCISKIPTFANPRGICSVTMKDSCVIAYPAESQGKVGFAIDPLSDEKPKIDIKAPFVAHEGQLACVALSQDGKYVATASDKGTLIRIFEVQTGNKVKEFRRGADQADIFTIAFSRDSSLLAVSSSKGTCHVFVVRTSKIQNRQSTSIFKGVLPYFSSEWSPVQVPLSKSFTSVCFTRDKKHLVAVSQDACYSKVSLITEKGELKYLVEDDGVNLLN